MAHSYKVLLINSQQHPHLQMIRKEVNQVAKNFLSFLDMFYAKCVYIHRLFTLELIRWQVGLHPFHFLCKLCCHYDTPSVFLEMVLKLKSNYLEARYSPWMTGHKI